MLRQVFHKRICIIGRVSFWVRSGSHVRYYHVSSYHIPTILSTDELHRGPIFLDYFHKPNAAEIGTMVAILEVGAFISSLIVGRLGDIIGRRRTILYGSLIFVSSFSLPNPR